MVRRKVALHARCANDIELREMTWPRSYWLKMAIFVLLLSKSVCLKKKGMVAVVFELVYSHLFERNFID